MSPSYETRRQRRILRRLAIVAVIPGEHLLTEGARHVLTRVQVEAAVTSGGAPAGGAAPSRRPVHERRVAGTLGHQAIARCSEKEDRIF